MEQIPPREHQYHSPADTNHLHGPHVPAASEPAAHPLHHKAELKKLTVPRGFMVIAGLILLAALVNFILNRNLNGSIKLASVLDILLAAIMLVGYELARRMALYFAVLVIVVQIIIGGLLLKDRGLALSANNKSAGITQTNIQKSTSAAEHQYYAKVYSELTAINKNLSSSYARGLGVMAGVIGIKLVAVFYLVRLRNQARY